MRVNIVVQNPQLIKPLKNLLEETNAIGKPHKISRRSDGSAVIPTNVDADFPPTAESFLRCLLNDKEEAPRCKSVDFLTTLASECTIEIAAPEVSSKSPANIHDTVQRLIQELTPDIPACSLLLQNLPSRWSLYAPMVLFPCKTFETEVWTTYLSRLENCQQEYFWQSLLTQQFHGCTHVAVNHPIPESDTMRRPQNLLPLYGDFGPAPNDKLPDENDFSVAFWCHTKQNGVHQIWAPRHTMFSRGNIKEKARVLNDFTDIEDKVCVDLYAGIGYFTFSYLKRGAKHVFCWEINPWSVKGLRKGMEANGFKYQVIMPHESITRYDPSVRAYIFQESNEFACERLKGFVSLTESKLAITHINLGLLPSSRPSWAPSLDIVKDYSLETSTLLHVHENVETVECQNFLQKLKCELTEIAASPSRIEPCHLEKIKTFAPDVWHICADMRVFK